MDTFRGHAGRVVVPSSADVYRAFGRLHRTEPGAPDPIPLREDAPLRAELSIHGEEYEKRWVEDRGARRCARLPGTVLRYPAIYGPGDRRLSTYVQSMLADAPVDHRSKTARTRGASPGRTPRTSRTPPSSR